MNQATLVSEICRRTGSSREQAQMHLRTLLDVVGETVASGERITLPGFGRFERIEVGARQGRDFRSGESVEIPGQHRLRFRPCGALRTAVAAG